jgi:predicted ATPase
MIHPSYCASQKQGHMQSIANRYRILSELGQGGMGTVYKAEDSLTHSIVAIKHLKSELTAPELIERFKREGEALRELNHPNIVKMLDTVEENGNHYLIIEYLAAGDLNKLLKQGQLPTERILKLAIEIADALTRAHHLNIIHRDLKPANVLIAGDGTPRLTDFGIAHIKGKARVTASDAIIGTIDYLAPEILDGAALDPRVDVWAFGVVLFEMLAGKRPFMGDSLAQTLMAIVTQPTPDLETLCPDAPIALVDLVYRMLEKDPHARIASVRRVGAELEDILQGRTNNPQPVSATNRFNTPTPDFLHRPKHNLPAQTTAFVGREAELAELAKLLDSPNLRLITIVAQGGMGKTRLALELAEKALTPDRSPKGRGEMTGFANGVYVVELAPLSDHNNVVSAIADATGYQFQADGRDQKQQVLDFLGNKKMLLLMDNYEHLLEGAVLVTDILKAAPQVKILATSRQRLNQSGETVFNLQGMDFPAWETPVDALEYASVKLFLQGAKRAKPDFEVTADNMDGIARICKLVQGMPLGILLAASWVAMLSPDEIAAEITQSIDFLTSELSDMPERQRSMRAVFDYSWDLMSEDEHAVFMKLSVFRGGFTCAAAEAIAGANLRILMNLINKSLIRRDADSGRYQIHELVRQYGEAQLIAQDELTTTQNSHALYYAQFMAQQWVLFKSPRQIDALNTIEGDYENVRIAWHYLVDTRQAAALREFISCMWFFTLIRRGIYEQLELMVLAVEKLRSVEQSEARDISLGHALSRQAATLELFRRMENVQAISNEAVTILQQYDCPEEMVLALDGLSGIEYRLKNLTMSERAAEQGLMLAEAHDYQWGRTRCLRHIGLLMDFNGDFEGALQIVDQILKIATDPMTIAFTIVFLQADVATRLGNYAEARQLYLQVLNIFKSMRFSGLNGFIYRGLGRSAYREGDYNQARIYYQQAIQHQLENRLIEMYLMLVIEWCELLVKLGILVGAVTLGNCLLKYKQPNVFVYNEDNIPKLLADLSSQIDADEYNKAIQRGHTLDLETVVQELLVEFGDKQA